MNNRLLSALVGLILTSAGAAQAATKVTLVLDSIELKDTSEAHGDELYFNVTEYSSIKSPDHYQVPSYPTHWLSEGLKQVTNVTLWERAVLDKEAVSLIVSLVERDAPPWNVDDLVGTVKLKLKEADGVVDAQWTLPDQTLASKVQGKDFTYDLTGENSQYRIKFHLTQSKVD